LAEEARGDPDGNELLGLAGHGAADAARAAEFFGGGFRYIGKVEPAIRNMPRAPCGSLGAR
jgi:hypothetical protein